jgi:hypothetical protein
LEEMATRAKLGGSNRRRELGGQAGGHLANPRNLEDDGTTDE